MYIYVYIYIYMYVYIYICIYVYAYIYIMYIKIYSVGCEAGTSWNICSLGAAEGSQWQNSVTALHKLEIFWLDSADFKDTFLIIFWGSQPW